MSHEKGSTNSKVMKKKKEEEIKENRPE